MKLQRKILSISGSDRVRFLNDLITVPVEVDMPLRYGALLTAQGKIFADLFLWSEGDTLFLDVHETVFEALLSKLQLYKMRADIVINMDARNVYQCAGEGDPRGNVGSRNYEADDGWSESEYQNARIVHCVPEFGVDFASDEAYPREWRFDEMAGVDYKKGCFVGQEIVARMRHKSDLNKSVVRVSADFALMRDMEITSGAKPVGRILSSNENNALAFLRLKGVDMDKLEIGGAPLTLYKRG